MEEQDVKSRLKNIEKSIISFEGALLKRRDSASERFPAPFLFLSTFGVVCILYGLEKIIDATPYLAKNPYLLIVAGAAILVGTGAFYRKLQ